MYGEKDLQGESRTVEGETENGERSGWLRKEVLRVPGWPRANSEEDAILGAERVFILSPLTIGTRVISRSEMRALSFPTHSSP